MFREKAHYEWNNFTCLSYNPTGQERFGNMTRVYYKEAVGAFVVFDVTRGSTFEAVSKWKHDLDSKVKLANGNPIPSVLLANKCDQKKESFNSKALMDNFCKETGFLGWFETSAKVRDWATFLAEAVGRSVFSGTPEAIRALMSLRSGESRGKRPFFWMTPSLFTKEVLRGRPSWRVQSWLLHTGGCEMCARTWQHLFALCFFFATLVLACVAIYCSCGRPDEVKNNSDQRKLLGICEMSRKIWKRGLSRLRAGFRLTLGGYFQHICPERPFSPTWCSHLLWARQLDRKQTCKTGWLRRLNKTAISSLLPIQKYSRTPTYSTFI